MSTKKGVGKAAAVPRAKTELPAAAPAVRAEDPFIAGPLPDGVRKDDAPSWPLKVFWSWAEKSAVMVLAGIYRKKLSEVGQLALRRGLVEMAREEIAHRERMGVDVPPKLRIIVDEWGQQRDAAPK